jgi:uncharacterized protein YaeQ
MYAQHPHVFEIVSWLTHNGKIVFWACPKKKVEQKAALHVAIADDERIAKVELLMKHTQRMFDALTVVKCAFSIETRCVCSPYRE